MHSSSVRHSLVSSASKIVIPDFSLLFYFQLQRIIESKLRFPQLFLSIPRLGRVISNRIKTAQPSGG